VRGDAVVAGRHHNVSIRIVRGHRRCECAAVGAIAIVPRWPRASTAAHRVALQLPTFQLPQPNLDLHGGESMSFHCES
jgi:hypothetical protein